MFTDTDGIVSYLKETMSREEEDDIARASHGTAQEGDTERDSWPVKSEPHGLQRYHEIMPSYSCLPNQPPSPPSFPKKRQAERTSLPYSVVDSLGVLKVLRNN